jgi:rhamnosyltransferase
MSMVAAVVPGFAPDLGEISTLVAALIEAGLPTLVVDDGSPDPMYLVRLEDLGAVTAAHASNAGIARSLNDGVRFAVSKGAQWLLTMDQDSSLPAGYVDALLAAAHPGVGVVGAETIADAAGDLRYPARVRKGQLVTEEVFQTGSLWSIAAMQEIGCFDEDLGIDAVDASACLKLREAGYTVALAPGLRLEHHFGSGQKVRLLGRDVFASGHSPARRETMVRNRLHLFPREFRQSPRHALRTIRRLGVNVLLAVTVENDRWAKAKGAARGLLPNPKR